MVKTWIFKVPLNQKRNLIHSLCTRARRICIEDEFQRMHINNVYLPRFIRQNLKPKQQCERVFIARKKTLFMNIQVKRHSTTFEKTGFRNLLEKHSIWLSFVLSFLVVWRISSHFGPNQCTSIGLLAHAEQIILAAQSELFWNASSNITLPGFSKDYRS